MFSTPGGLGLAYYRKCEAGHPSSQKVPHSHNVRESGFRIPDSGISEIFACGIRKYPKSFCLWIPESWAMEFGIPLKESGIPLTIDIQNPSSPDKDLENGTWNPESKTVLDTITWGDSHVNGLLGFV